MRNISEQMHLQVTQRSSILRRYGSCMRYTCPQDGTLVATHQFRDKLHFTLRRFILRTVQCVIRDARCTLHGFKFQLQKLT